MQEKSVRLEEVVNNALQAMIHADLRSWKTRNIPEKWSKNELLGHLIDSANNNIQRFVRATYTTDLKINYHQDEWVNAQYYNETETKNLIHLWHLLNLQIIRILNHYPSDRMDVMCDTGKEKPSLYSIDFLATDYIDHLEYHLKQLLK